MKTLSGNFKIFILLLIQCFCISFAAAQSRIVSTQEHESGNTTSGYGRDLWFAIPQNYVGSAQKYFNIYVNSTHNTTVNFQVGGGPVIRKPLTAGQVTMFKTPTPKAPAGDFSLTNEITTSGVVETKTFHIWSDNADIAVYLLSRRDFSSDGAYIIPSIGWGKEYVVGAYSSLVVPGVDLPSEFVVIANKDNTLISVIPNWDLRKNGFPDTIEHKKGIPFTQLLNRGECIQYQVLGNPQDDQWDVTGTVVTANNPIGVIGASVCPFITLSDPYCDHIMDMLQPVRSWSNSYFTAPFAGRLYGGDGFLLVGSRNGQVIFQNNLQVAIVNKYQPFFVYDIVDPSHWTSDDPFMLVQYVCSATHGVPQGKPRNAGDPAMVVMNGADQFRKDIIFQTPKIDLASGQTTFTNYVNVLLPTSHEGSTTYDGKLIRGSSFPGVKLIEKFPIPNTSWEAIRFTYNIGVGEGAHHITSDTGIGAYVYGFGTDDSYAWSGHLGTTVNNSSDTIPPSVSVSGACFCSHVRMFDKGPTQSKLSSFIVDSSFNMTFVPDSNFIPGAGQDSSFYDICVIDYSAEAYSSISIYDIAGNRTTVISKYKPQLVTFSQNPLNFGSVSVGNSASLYDTICNTSQVPYHFKSANLSLLNNNLGFSIDSSYTDGDIPVGGCRVIKIRFTPLSPPTVKDTLALFDSCLTITCPIIGNGGVPDFALSDFNFGCITLGTVSKVDATVAANFGAGIITIDSIWTDDAVHFTFSGTPKLPLVLKSKDQSAFQFNFTPTTKDTICTTVHFHSLEAGEHTAKLCGCGLPPSAVGTKSYYSTLSKESSEYSLISSQLDKGADLFVLPPVPNPTQGSHTVRFAYGMKYDSQTGLEIYDIIGNLVAAARGDGFQYAGIYEINLPIPSKMTSGNYIYRLFGAGKVISGKLVVTK